MQQKHLTVFIKPASDLCQMSCTYCFYRELATQTSPHALMTGETAHKLLQRIMAHGADTVQFAFQGGEPLLWGVDNFYAFCKQVSTLGIHATYAIQTNGLAIDETFCSLFATYDFLVGVSLDGPRADHDKYRQTNHNGGTFDQVKATLSLLKKHHIRHNILTVVTADTAQHPTRLYQFFKRLGVSHVQLIPCLPPMDDTKKAVNYTPTPSQYASFLKNFYRLWREDFVQGVPPFSVRTFDQCLDILKGQGNFCGGFGQCTPQLVVEADGSLYPCDFYVLSSYQTGHIDTHTIEETLQTEGMQHFICTHPPTPSLCASCRYVRVCGGGCRRMRDVYLQGDSDVCPLQALMDFMITKERFMS